MARENGERWNDDDAFFIRQAENEERKKRPTTPNRLAIPGAEDGAPQSPRRRSNSICGILDDVQSDNKTVLEEPDQAAFYLDDAEATAPRMEAPPSPSLSSKMTAKLKLLRDSPAISDNLKDTICLTLQERNISAEELLAKSDEDVEFLFPDPEMRKAVCDWRYLETWRRDVLPTEALRLVKATKAGNLDVVKEIMQNSAIPNLGKKLLVDHRDMNSHARTPLMHAARHGHLAVIGFLVKVQNADIYARDSHKFESMAIHFAAQGGYVEIVRFLAGVDPKLVEAKNKNGDTPLNMTAVTGKLNVVECLVSEKRANIENRGQHGMTPLLCAAEKGHSKVVRFLVEKGADVCAKDEKHADMAIHWAARFDHVDIVSYLLDKSPGLLEAVNHLGRTPLHQASIGGHLAVVKLLAKKGANLLAMSNAEDLISNAIHLAAYFGHTAVVAFLLDTNPDDLLEIENRDEKTPYVLAREEKHTETMQLLESRGARKTARRKML